MSIFAFLFFFIQVCLVQNVYSQCYGYGPVISPGLAPYELGAGLAAGPFGIAPMAVEIGGLGSVAPVVDLGAYGGAGVGDVAVAGEMPVVGTTLVAGQVPILGSVRFAGDLPAAGTVTITGSCGCGCGLGAYY